MPGVNSNSNNIADFKNDHIPVCKSLSDIYTAAMSNDREVISKILSEGKQRAAEKRELEKADKQTEKQKVAENAKTSYKTLLKCMAIAAAKGESSIYYNSLPGEDGQVFYCGDDTFKYHEVWLTQAHDDIVVWLSRHQVVFQHPIYNYTLHWREKTTFEAACSHAWKKVLSIFSESAETTKPAKMVQDMAYIETD